MNRNLGITLRTALLSWLVTIVTVFIFVIVIIPMQKRIFLENLESKARGVYASLYDVVSGAVVNEDYSSVVDYCKGVLDGDPGLEYLVIAKNDGFVLFNYHQGWTSETGASKYWRPNQREAASGVGVVPRFHRRVFYFSQPFDYSGIKWGWIHVGLSLDRYDRSVVTVYRRTGLLAILCIGLSLLASVVYAKRLVRPILHLRGVVQKVAAGDLSVRAKVLRGDELGSLASSVNAMTNALLHRDHILESVRFAAQEFLSPTKWTATVQEVLTQTGQATGVSRIHIFENQGRDSSPMTTQARYEWTAPGIDPLRSQDTVPGKILHGADFADWLALLQRREIIATHYRELSTAQQRAVGMQDVKSFLVIPIMVEQTWWGILTLAECHTERSWTEAEKDSIRAVADMLGAAIARQRTQDELLEAKELLEQRVQERTHELQEQVAAKEKAHAALAEAQNRLMEASRKAGQAEVATGVLHNVGNVLNSVNVSANLVADRVRHSKIDGLGKAVTLMQEHTADLGSYLTTDPKGKMIMEYLRSLASHLMVEKTELANEICSLIKNVEHIKEIVAMQQSYATVSGLREVLPIAQVVDDALQMHAAAFTRYQIQVIRDYQNVPLVILDKHKVLQILLNIFHNAKYALMECKEPGPKMLNVKIGQNGAGRIKISVRDNGMGVSPENLTRIFSCGFTTKKDGHGFGLHTGALSAQDMGGSLTAASEGLGRGATFTLELPVSQENH